MVVLRHALPIGTALHGYEILGVLGAGGFGVTYLARDQKLGSLRAIKEFYPRDLVERDPQLAVTVRNEEERPGYDAGLRSFLSEARIGASLDHPGIAQVQSFFEAHGTGYVVMPYYDGATLQQRLQSAAGPLSRDEVLEILLPILDALEYVHDRGLIHRDIKPANIYLRSVGGPLLIDFGAARMASRGTRPLTAILTPGYAPPEQYLPDAPQGAFTDLYAVGAVLYRMISGNEPKDAYTRSVGGLDGDPLVPVSRLLCDGYPPVFLAAIDRCLRMNSAARFATVAELRAALLPQQPQLSVSQPATQIAPGPAPSPKPDAVIAPALMSSSIPLSASAAGLPSRRGVWLPILLAVTALALLAGGLWWALRSPPQTMLTGPAADNRIAHPVGSTFRDHLADGTDGPEMIALPAGSFSMGSMTLELHREDTEGPQHEVQVAAFALGRFELTVAEFRAFVHATGYSTDAERDRSTGQGLPSPGCQVELIGGIDWLRNTSWQQPMRPIKDREPVVCVSNDDAMAYAFWLSSETGQRYRLPSETELEYALRDGRTGSSWHWPDDALPQFCQYANLDDSQTAGWVEQPCRDEHAMAAPVGSFQPSAWGLYDLSGNVTEWTADCWHPDYIGAPADGTARLPAEGAECHQRLTRGGSWHDGLPAARVAARSAHPLAWRSVRLGVRLARDLQP